MSEEKHCNGCATTKPLADFYRTPAGHHVSRCKVCRKAQAAETYRRRSPEARERYLAQQRERYAANPHIRRDWTLRRTYGITLAEFDAMVEQQGGVCAICDSPAKGRSFLCVDQCHTTGAVRALLCHTCNAGLGFLKDDPSLARKAATYLESYA